MKFALENFNESKAFNYLILIFIAVLIIYPFGVYYFWGKWENSGVFGDSFGMITSMFSGFAVILLIITLIIQKKEFRITRDEFELSRKAQESASNSMKLQSENLIAQRMDNIFFTLLEKRSNFLETKQIFNHPSFKHIMSSDIDAIFSEQTERTEAIKRTYRNYCSLKQNELYQIGRNTELILTIIGQIEHGKKFYIDIFKSILSIEEEVYLKCYIFFEKDPNNLKDLINKFQGNLFMMK